MAFRFCDSFDHYATADILTKWTAANQATIVAGRNGSGCQLGASNQGFLAKTLTHMPTCIIGGAAKISAGGSTVVLFQASSANQHSMVELAILPDNTLALYAGDSSHALIGNSTNTIDANIFNFYELKASWTGGTNAVCTATARLNGQVILTGSGTTGVDTNNTINGSATVNYFIFGASNGLTPSITWDDIYICDTSTAGTNTNTDFLGDVNIQCIFPATNVSTNFLNFPSTNTDAKTLVNEHAPDYDTTYVFSSATTSKEEFNYDPISAFTGTIRAVQYLIFARKDQEGSRGVNLTMGGVIGTSAEFGSVAYLNDYYQYYHIPYDSDNGVAWTPAVVNAEKWGVTVAV